VLLDAGRQLLYCRGGCVQGYNQRTTAQHARILSAWLDMHHSLCLYLYSFVVYSKAVIWRLGGGAFAARAVGVGQACSPLEWGVAGCCEWV
jgi:hypothetical protein